MLLKDLEQSVIVLSGHMGLPNFEFDDMAFIQLLNAFVLPVMRKYRPATIKTEINTVAAPYTFETAEGIPDFISRVIPTSVWNPTGVFSQYRAYYKIRNIRKPVLLWRYEKPNLYIDFNGQFEVTKHFGPRIQMTNPSLGYWTEFTAENWYEKPVDSTDASSQYAIAYLDTDDEDDFTMLTLGYILIAIGRKRKLAKIGNIDVDLNGGELVKDGQAIVDDAKKNIMAKVKFYLAGQ